MLREQKVNRNRICVCVSWCEGVEVGGVIAGVPQIYERVDWISEGIGK